MADLDFRSRREEVDTWMLPQIPSMTDEVSSSPRIVIDMWMLPQIEFVCTISLIEMESKETTEEIIVCFDSDKDE